MRFAFLVLTLLGFYCRIPAQALSSAKADSGLLNSPPHSEWGYAVMDVKTGSTLTQNGGHRFLVPASIVKLLTTAFVLDKMDPARRFPTVLYRSGPIEKGVLHGDLWIRGGGNPALGSERGDSSQRIDSVFGLFVRALEEAGIHEVDGSVHGDGSLLDAEAPARGDLWEDVGNYYGAAPSGLCFHDNSYTLQLIGSGTPDSPSIQGVFPLHIGVSRFQIRTQTGAAPSGDSCFILGAFWDTPRLIVGNCAAGKTPLEIKGSLPDPAWTCARNFEDFLREHGFALKDPGRKNAPERSDDPLPGTESLPSDTVRLAEHLSPALLDLVGNLLSKSDNMYATQLMTLAGMESGMPHNSRGGIQAFRLWLDARRHSDSPEAHLVDGNGLSLQDQLTPAFLVQQLSSFSGAPWFYPWRETLLRGTSRLLNAGNASAGLEGKLWIKTGSMTGVSSLAGYLQTRSGRLLAFAILVNHFDAPAGAVRNQWEPLLRAWQERY